MCIRDRHIVSWYENPKTNAIDTYVLSLDISDEAAAIEGVKADEEATVIGREAIPFEVQIRTREMDRNAEYGIAAHWKYKAGITAASSDRLDERLAWVRQLLESQRSSIDATDLLSDIKSDLLPEEVFAFTPVSYTHLTLPTICSV